MDAYLHFFGYRHNILFLGLFSGMTGEQNNKKETCNARQAAGY